MTRFRCTLSYVEITVATFRDLRSTDNSQSDVSNGRSLVWAPRAIVGNHWSPAPGEVLKKNLAWRIGASVLSWRVYQFCEFQKICDAPKLRRFNNVCFFCETSSKWIHFNCVFCDWNCSEINLCTFESHSFMQWVLPVKDDSSSK